MEPTLLLMSGGLDSTSLMLHLLHRKESLVLFHVDYGQKAFIAEMTSVSYFAKKYKIPVKWASVDVSQLGVHASVLKNTPVGKKQEENKLDGRNILLVAMAAMFASASGIRKIVVGFHKEPSTAPFPDATFETWQALGNVLETAFRPAIEIEAPFWSCSRLEILKFGINLDGELVKKTFTCYESGPDECGVCVHCLAKRDMLLRLKEEGVA